MSYQLQVQIPQDKLGSLEDLKNVPVATKSGESILLRNLAKVTEGKVVGQYERYNMQRMITLTANIYGADLGTVSRHVAEAVRQAGDPPPKTRVDVRGQVIPLEQMLSGLQRGLLLTIVVIFLLLAAYFESLPLSFIVISTVPAAVAGVVVSLWLTGTTLNIQSLMGAIMSVGVAVANAILLITFAERTRLKGAAARAAALDGAESRLRPILMTSLAMIAGMIPLALGFGEGGEQSAPLGRAVIGGLAAATLATLFVLPALFSILRARSRRHSISLDPTDPLSRHHASTI